MESNVTFSIDLAVPMLPTARIPLIPKQSIKYLYMITNSIIQCIQRDVASLISLFCSLSKWGRYLVIIQVVI